jgi:ribosome-associated toxin RatA of RatAB toxin-antitoxin module
MKFEHSAVVEGSPEDVFALTQDYARRLTWDPFLREAVLLGGAAEPGVGVRAWCVARSGAGMETEYVSFAPPRVAAVKMTRGPRILETFGGTWEFAPVEGGRTRVTFRYLLRVRPRWLAWLLEPLAGWWFSRETRIRVAALEKAARAGLASGRERSSPGARA